MYTTEVLDYANKKDKATVEKVICLQRNCE